ncbi:Nuclear pore complex protein [Nymphaea thermarum]|nr:Nuclear pore complex protein [Nymphaea thermarum]
MAVTKGGSGKLVELEEKEGVRELSDDYMVRTIGMPVPLLRSKEGFDEDDPPAQGLAISERLGLMFVAHHGGFFMANTKDVLSLAKDMKESNKVSSIQDLSIVDISLAGIPFLQLSLDSSVLAACWGGELQFFSTDSLVKKEGGRMDGEEEEGKEGGRTGRRTREEGKEGGGRREGRRRREESRREGGRRKKKGRTDGEEEEGKNGGEKKGGREGGRRKKGRKEEEGGKKKGRREEEEGKEGGGGREEEGKEERACHSSLVSLPLTPSPHHPAISTRATAGGACPIAIPILPPIHLCYFPHCARSGKDQSHQTQQTSSPLLGDTLDQT